MKVAIFTDSFLPGVGGTEKAVLGLGEALNEMLRGEGCLISAPRFARNYKDEFKVKVLRANSIKVTKNDCLAFPNFSKKFKKELKEFKPDIIHCHTVSPMTAYAIKYAKKNNIPVIMTVHTKFRYAFYGAIKIKFIVNIMLKNLVKKLNKVDGVYTVSNDMIPELQSYGYKGDIKVIRNGAMFTKVDDRNNYMEIASKNLNISKNKIIFLYVGYIVKYKNLQFTLDALKIIKDAGIDFTMLFVGAGFDMEFMKDYTKKLGLEESVIFTGKITDPELLRSVYCIADLYLFPSIFDNDPLTVVESASNELPAVTLENTGASERIVDNVSGFVSKNSVTDYANKILEVIKDREKLKQVGKNAKNMIPKEWKETAQEYIQEYEKIISQYSNKNS